MTLEDFIENGPLYSKIAADKDALFPKRLTRYCDKCAKETTWGVDDNANFNTAGRNFYRASYECVLCEGSWMAVILVATLWKKYEPPAVGWYPVEFEKISQYPRPSVKIPGPIAKVLGSSADLYRKALICRNQGFGIAALAYIRRVVEDKTNALIEVVEELAKVSRISAEEVAKIRSAREEKTTYDQKLRLASEAIPLTLRPDGVNPLGLLYGFVSEGIHGRSEEECLQITDEIRDVFEYVFGQLRAQVDNQKDFVTRVKKWAGGQKPV